MRVSSPRSAGMAFCLVTELVTGGPLIGRYRPGCQPGGISAVWPGRRRASRRRGSAGTPGRGGRERRSGDRMNRAAGALSAPSPPVAARRSARSATGRRPRAPHRQCTPHPVTDLDKPKILPRAGEQPSQVDVGGLGVTATYCAPERNRVAVGEERLVDVLGYADGGNVAVGQSPGDAEFLPDPAHSAGRPGDPHDDGRISQPVNRVLADPDQLSAFAVQPGLGAGRRED
jgi:hypothetical protein